MRRCVPNATFEKPNARLKNDEKVEHTISQLRRMLKTALLVEHVKKVHWRTSAVTRCLTSGTHDAQPHGGQSTKQLQRSITNLLNPFILNAYHEILA